MIPDAQLSIAQSSSSGRGYEYIPKGIKSLIETIESSADNGHDSSLFIIEIFIPVHHMMQDHVYDTVQLQVT
jgi:hypothetical protein